MDMNIASSASKQQIWSTLASSASLLKHNRKDALIGLILYWKCNFTVTFIIIIIMKIGIFLFLFHNYI